MRYRAARTAAVIAKEPGAAIRAYTPCTRIDKSNRSGDAAEQILGTDAEPARRFGINRDIGIADHSGIATRGSRGYSKGNRISTGCYIRMDRVCARTRISVPEIPVVCN